MRLVRDVKMAGSRVSSSLLSRARIWRLAREVKSPASTPGD